MDPQFTAWVQAGGVLAFAAAVFFELRKQRTIIERMTEAIVALLERARIEDVTPPLGTRTPEGFRRPHTPVRGIDIVKMSGVPRKRTHSDDDDDGA